VAEFIAQIGTLLAGKMAGSTNKANFIVKTLRTVYVVDATVIAVVWYSAWRNERVKPGEINFPVPGWKKLKRQFSPDRPEHELEDEGAFDVPHREWGTSKSQHPPSVLYGSGTYVYPFANTATVGRVDQGQDFGGTGPIYAIGKARILKTGAPGWPGGEQGVLYQLLDGARRGQIIFVYEGIKVQVQQNDIVQAGQKIGEFIPFSPTGIEIGFADAMGVPLSHAEYTEGKETVYGKEMKAFLESLKSKPRHHPQPNRGGSYNKKAEKGEVAGPVIPRPRTI
jgi:hypothetical protein